MSLKRELINYLEKNGKTDTWVNIYNKFPIRGREISNKQKSDTIRKIYKRKIHNRKTEFKLNSKLETNKVPKILVFDVETSPKRAYVWRMFKENISATNGQLQSETFMLTWSAKWLFDDYIMSDKLTPKEVLEENDSRIVKSMWELFNEAQVVIAHNALGFDVKVLNTRFIRNGLTPPTPYQIIDTLRHARKHFKFESNRLDYLGKIFNLGSKISTDFSLWERCMRGEEKALEEMRVYNDQDVKLLEEVYLHMRPFISPHPNLNLIIENNVSACPSCMSEDLNWNGKYHTYANTYNSFTCNSCGSIGRSRSNATPKKVKQSLTISTPTS